jgi:hypothetical protein
MNGVFHPSNKFSMRIGLPPRISLPRPRRTQLLIIRPPRDLRGVSVSSGTANPRERQNGSPAELNDELGILTFSRHTPTSSPSLSATILTSATYSTICASPIPVVYRSATFPCCVGIQRGERSLSCQMVNWLTAFPAPM